MSPGIQTRQIGRGIVDSTWVVLQETPDTALIFKPQIHDGGVRGTIVRCKKERDESWTELVEQRIVSLNLYEGMKFELTTDAAKRLFEAIRDRQQIAEQGVRSGSNEYITAPANEVLVITDENKRTAIRQLLGLNASDDFWNLLRDTDPELATKLARSQIQSNRAQALNQLTERLEHGTFHESTGSDSWQSWVYAHNWMFGVQYEEPIERMRINLSGSMPDYLFPTVDGYLDILEIKLPTDAVIIEETSRPGTFRWSPDANVAIGQVVNYLDSVEHYRYELRDKILHEYGKTVSIIKPRATILIGNSSGWSQPKKDGLRKMNHMLHGAEVITYKDLHQRGSAIAQMPDV